MDKVRARERNKDSGGLQPSKISKTDSDEFNQDKFKKKMCFCFCLKEKFFKSTDQFQFSETNKIPIVYSNEYNVQFCGLQKLHPFDAAKGYHILKILKSANFIQNESYVRPTKQISTKELLAFHTKRYIKSLKWSLNVAKIAEIPLLLFVPNAFIQRGYLRPMRFQTAGSIMAGKLALLSGWAINLGGGFHHCSSDKGGGFCPYADISLLVQSIFTNELGVHKIMIVDLDAHQGNGHERDFLNNPNVYILDIYNGRIYPKDSKAKAAIRMRVELAPFTEDIEYLQKVNKNLIKSLAEFKPDLIVFNAGSDILAGDPLGLLSISPDGVIKRDEIVFKMAIHSNIPIVMLLSGGYLRSSAEVIANSILNLHSKGLLRTKF